MASRALVVGLVGASCLASTVLAEPQCALSEVALRSVGPSAPHTFIGTLGSVVVRVKSDEEKYDSAAFFDGSIQSAKGKTCPFEPWGMNKLFVTKNERVVLTQADGASNGWAYFIDTATCETYPKVKSAWDVQLVGDVIEFRSGCEPAGDNSGWCAPANVYRLEGAICRPVRDQRLSEALTLKQFGVLFSNLSLIENIGTPKARIIPESNK